MITFGEVYRDICQGDYSITYEAAKQYLGAEYVGQPGNPARVELIWRASSLQIPRLIRGEIFDTSVEIFSGMTGEDLRIDRERAVIGSTAVASELYDPEMIVKLLTDGEYGLPLAPFQNPGTRHTKTIG